MASIIKDRRIVTDHWQHLTESAPLPARGDIIVSWTRWQRERDALAAHDGRLGVRVGGDVEPERVAADQAHFQLIALEFPQFKDGRCYSHARLLRERYGFRGELRAVGDVLRDQLFYMYRVGINAFELRADRDPQAALGAFDDFSASYQAAADTREPLWQRRRRA